MIRLIAGGLLCLACALLGFAVKKHYIDRVEIYREIVAFSERLEKDVGFLKTPLIDIISNFISENDQKKSLFVPILKSYMLDLRAGNEIKTTTTLLSEKENEELSDFFKVLGKDDFSETLKKTEYFKKTFSETLAVKEADAKRLGGMYFKLFVILGLALLIIVA